MIGPRFLARQIARELRGVARRLVAFVLCLAVGVAAVVIVATISRSLDHGIRLEARNLLAADLAISASRPVPPEILDIKGSGWLAVGGLLSYVSFAVGWALFGLAVYRARVVAPLVGLGVVVGGLIGYAAVLPPYGVPLGLAVSGLGLAVILQTRRQNAPTPSLHGARGERP